MANIQPEPIWMAESSTARAVAPDVLRSAQIAPKAVHSPTMTAQDQRQPSTRCPALQLRVHAIQARKEMRRAAAEMAQLRRTKFGSGGAVMGTGGEWDGRAVCPGQLHDAPNDKAESREGPDHGHADTANDKAKHFQQPGLGE